MLAWLMRILCFLALIGFSAQRQWVAVVWVVIALAQHERAEMARRWRESQANTLDELNRRIAQAEWFVQRRGQL